MPRRGAHKASGHKATSAISGREEGGAAEPIEARPRSKPALDATARFGPGLYIVATPIGNLRDVTLRALDLLGAADLVACEDTRVTAKLMTRYGLAAPRIAYHEHNAEQMRPQLIERLKQGMIVALVSDAGTPLISDPGYRLVRAALAEGIPVTALPGPSSALTGLVLSALPCDRFLFVGFLPPKSVARQRVLREVATTPATLIFFETAPRLAGALADMALTLGERPAAIARELTKLFEEVRRGSLAELAAHYRDAGAPKGELVVVVGAGERAETGLIDEAALDAELGDALATMSVKDAAAAVAEKMGQPRRLVYQRALVLAGRST